MDEELKQLDERRKKAALGLTAPISLSKLERAAEKQLLTNDLVEGLLLVWERGWNVGWSEGRHGD